ncbi:MAG: DMT family transporter [Kiritimatiellae bacterium]|nr:DMT family transporter [Kiritimatiellia bacterium]
MNNRKYLVPLFTAFLCWGSIYVVSKVAMRAIPPVTLLALRYLIAVPTLFLLLKIRGALRPLKKEHMGTVFAIGFTGYFASFCLQMLGINRLSGSVSSLLGAMNPIFIPILASIFLKEQLTIRKILCVAVSMTGVVIIVGVGGSADPLGVILMLMSVFLWSTASIIIRKLGGKYDPMQIAMMAIICAIPLTGAWSLIELREASLSFPLPSLLALIYMGTIGTAAPHSLWNYCLSKMDASFCSMFYPLQPLVASTLGVLFLGESITINFLLGAAIICCGIVAAVLSGKNKA